MSKKKKNSKMITVSVTEDALKEIKKMLWATDVCGQLLPDLHASNAFAVGCMAAMERDYEGIYFDLVDGSIKVMAMFPLDKYLEEFKEVKKDGKKDTDNR